MNARMCRGLFLVLSALLLTACTQPLSKAARERSDPDATLAMVSDNPAGFVDRQLLLGGAVVRLEKTGTGSELEILEWQLNRWGEPLYLDDSARRFLAKTSQDLDAESFEPGVLVSLAGIVRGEETRSVGEQEIRYPVFEATEIHLWESPFRYGIHRSSDPDSPRFINADDGPDSNPYNPGYNPYPYTQHDYRNHTD